MHSDNNVFRSSLDVKFSILFSQCKLGPNLVEKLNKQSSSRITIFSDWKFKLTTGRWCFLIYHFFSKTVDLIQWFLDWKIFGGAIPRVYVEGLLVKNISFIIIIKNRRLLGWSSRKIVILLPRGNSTWSPRLDLLRKDIQ